MSIITGDVFGTASTGEVIKRYTFKNDSGITIQVINLGGIVTSIVVPDKNGKLEDIVTGFDTVAEYEKSPAYFGAINGRFANRIAGGKFTLDGREYTLTINEPPNHVHGGYSGFDKKLFSSRVKNSKLILSYTSPDGEEGYPGTLRVDVVYELTTDKELYIDYTATTDKPTIINLSSHSGFNLDGHKAASIADHVLTINADHYLEKTENNTSSGVVANVESTPFDLRHPVLLGDRIPVITGPPNHPNGFEHNFCLKSGGDKALAGVLEHPETGRRMEIYTNQPGMHVYTGNFLNGIKGKSSARYEQYSSIVFETQTYPDAINHDNFPSCVLRPGEVYNHKIWYMFKVNS